MPTDDTTDATSRERRAAARLKELLDQADRGKKAELGRRLVEEGKNSGEQLPRKYVRGEIAFGRGPQRLLARLIREVGIAPIPDDYFEKLTENGPTPVAADKTRHPSLSRVLASNAYRPQTTKLLLSHDQSLDGPDPGDEKWRDLGAVIESMYAAADARREPSKPPSRGPSRRR